MYYTSENLHNPLYCILYIRDDDSNSNSKATHTRTRATCNVKEQNSCTIPALPHGSRDCNNTTPADSHRQAACSSFVRCSSSRTVSTVTVYWQYIVYV